MNIILEADMDIVLKADVDVILATDVDISIEADDPSETETDELASETVIETVELATVEAGTEAAEAFAGSVATALVIVKGWVSVMVKVVACDVLVSESSRRYASKKFAYLGDGECRVIDNYRCRSGTVGLISCDNLRDVPCGEQPCIRVLCASDSGARVP